MTSTELTIYAPGFIEDGESYTVDLAEEWVTPLHDITDAINGSDRPEAVRRDWDKSKSSFTYSHSGTKLLKITLKIEEIETLN